MGIFEVLLDSKTCASPEYRYAAMCRKGGRGDGSGSEDLDLLPLRREDLDFEPPQAFGQFFIAGGLLVEDIEGLRIQEMLRILLHLAVGHDACFECRRYIGVVHILADDYQFRPSVAPRFLPEIGTSTDCRLRRLAPAGNGRRPGNSVRNGEPSPRETGRSLLPMALHASKPYQSLRADDTPCGTLMCLAEQLLLREILFAISLLLFVV
mmetsp:Transcript_22528/g.54462  ORF Transcript_22528/g.54462 Transcript_22528/m.54462 type:complete len:209 (-) Transcript_22528:269-895(-)